MNRRAVMLVDPIRSPFGRYAGALSAVRPDDLLATALRRVIDRTGIPNDVIDDVIAGCVSQAGEDARNIARMSLLLAGLPTSTPGLTVNRLCASGLAAITTGARAIASDEADLILVGGVESMSRAPWVMAKPSRGFAPQPPEMYNTALGWRFVNPSLAEMHPPISMGETAENVAEKYAISRDKQDAFALKSHMRALTAWEDGFYDDHVIEISPPIPTRAGVTDEGPRPAASMDALAALKPAFRAGGTVTAGNSSSLNDGAGAALLASEEACERYSLEPVSRVVATGQAGVDPSYMGIGPVPATERAMRRAGWTMDDLDVIEINEAFAAQVLAVTQELGVDPDAVNRRGGAIAIGHPLGASGLRLAATACHEIRADPNARRAVITACIGVGQGESLLLERV